MVIIFFSRIERRIKYFYFGFLSVLKYNVIGDEIEDEELLIKIVVYVLNRFKIKE